MTKNKIISRIYGYGRGWVFTPKDFSDIASRGSIDMALMNYQKSGVIRKVSRGIYDYPKYSELLQTVTSPDFYRVALAIARNRGWSIAPSGDTALNMLGLSTQVPAQFTFDSTGGNFEVMIGAMELQFNSVPTKDFVDHPKAQLLISAIKALGKERVTEDIIQKLREEISVVERREILKVAKSATVWINSVIYQICKEGDNVQGSSMELCAKS